VEREGSGCEAVGEREGAWWEGRRSRTQVPLSNTSAVLKRHERRVGDAERRHERGFERRAQLTAAAHLQWPNDTTQGR
jgi:hypothetical protein